MISESIKIDLITKLNPSIFQVLNQNVLGVIPERLGVNVSAVKKMVVGRESMLKLLMPSIINTSPNDVKWYDTVNKYWNSFGLLVPPGGVSLETGLIYDINDSDRAIYISELIKRASAEGTEIKTDADLKIYIASNVSNTDRYKYTKPINVIDYLTWIYCLGHHEVANKTTDVTNSEQIRFTLIDQRDIIDLKRKAHTVSIDAGRKYLEILSDRSKVKDLLYILGYDSSVLSDIDADIQLKSYSDNNPTKFIEMLDDKTLTIKARIERYILAGVLKRMPNTGIIIDASDQSCVIGNTLDEAAVYFVSENKERVTKVSEFSAKYKQIKNNKK